MGKLLSDEELATQLIVMAKRIGASLDDAIDAKIEQNIVSLIRTEKLKLLAEVRERVIGEDLPLNTTPDTGQRIYSKVKADERAELTKLEAEL